MVTTVEDVPVTLTGVDAERGSSSECPEEDGSGSEDEGVDLGPSVKNSETCDNGENTEEGEERWGDCDMVVAKPNNRVEFDSHALAVCTLNLKRFITQKCIDLTVDSSNSQGREDFRFQTSPPIYSVLRSGVDLSVHPDTQG